MAYKFRGLPCNIQPDEKLWCVAGEFKDKNSVGGGILEWCYDQSDAEYLLGEMRQDPRFSRLHAHKFQD